MSLKAFVLVVPYFQSLANYDVLTDRARVHTLATHEDRSAGKGFGQECFYKHIIDAVLYEESAHDNSMELST